ncbi:ATP-binding protein [Halarcobacter sp.]|uniref:sensor histidine kinase n=1 Tax=Halarcobacter sp. TaxID=2321133 RepID=UPI0029F505E5|nr:ATP-binding protein [Halarcobacter sp.]
MNIENKVLARQLKKLRIDSYENLDEKKFEKLLNLISKEYENTDSNIYRLERALEISTSELRKFNDSLEERIETEVQKNREKDKQLFIQSRYAGMGEMIGNIAHQWRQPLSAISTISSGMLLELELDMCERKDIENSYEKILEFTKFLTQTIEDFRGYLKKDKEKVEFDILDIFMKSFNIVESTYKNNNIYINIKKDAHFSEKSFGFANELIQVFLNILNNAKDALLESEVEEKIVFIDILEGNEFNTISIIDNAGGINENIIEKIFDPYFTTKHKSQGTGIGLYMSKDIVEKNMHGKLSVTNINKNLDGTTYKGACFNISIPKSNTSN